MNSSTKTPITEFDSLSLPWYCQAIKSILPLLAPHQQLQFGLLERFLELKKTYEYLNKLNLSKPSPKGRTPIELSLNSMDSLISFLKCSDTLDALSPYVPGFLITLLKTLDTLNTLNLSSILEADEHSSTTQGQAQPFNLASLLNQTASLNLTGMLSKTQADSYSKYMKELNDLF